MPRNGSGTYDLPEPPFEPQTAIESSAVNDDFSDIGDALTGSVASDGQTPITGALKLANTGVVYNSDPDTGVYRTGANAQAIKCGGTDIVDVTTSGVDVTGSISRNGNVLLPAGVMMPYGGASAPDGWLLCYGQSLLRASYTELFTAIGTAFGAADGTHFSLPDLRGRLVAGKDNMGGSAASRLTSTTMTPDGVTLGAVGGEQTHTLITTEMPSHSHTASVTDPGHLHAITAQSGSGDIAFPGAGGRFLGGGNIGSQGSTNSNTTGITVSNSSTGGDTAHNNVQPTIITNYIIYAGV